jgi:hypothetical protein
LLVIVALLLGGLLLAQCGNDTTDPNDQQALPEQDDTEPTTTEEPVTTEAPTTTATPTTEAPTTTATPTTEAPATTTTEAPTTTVANQCPGDGALPADAQSQPAGALAGADVDGDGDIDTLHAYSTGIFGDPSGKSWVQVSFTGGGGSAYLVTGFDNTEFTMVNDGVDLDGDGTEEFFARVGGGPSSWQVGLFDVVDCELVRVMLDNGDDTDLVRQSSAAQVYFFSWGCVEVDLGGGNVKFDLIDSLGGRAVETDPWEVTYDRYSLQESTLVHVGTEITVQGPDDPVYPGMVSCPNSDF